LENSESRPRRITRRINSEEILNTAMAETNARREARRRRILENSESRLHRITGRINSDEIKDNNSQVKTDNPKAESNFEEVEDVGNGNVYSNVKLQDARFGGDEDFLKDTRNTCLPRQVSKSNFLCTLLFSRISLVLLAVIVNILLVLKLDILFGQAIIIPYLLLMLGRLYNCTTLHETQDGCLLVAALILCDVKPRLIHIFKVSLSLFTIILNDFGLYMFSFVLMRYVITRYSLLVAIIIISPNV